MVLSWVATAVVFAGWNAWAIFIELYRPVCSVYPMMSSGTHDWISSGLRRPG